VEPPDLLDVGAAEPHVLIGAERENPAQGAVQRPDREVFHLASLAFPGFLDDRRQGQHAEPTSYLKTIGLPPVAETFAISLFPTLIPERHQVPL
jgi:hypothetical protein